ncbi:nitroreductase [Streptococcus pneumoniae]|nr:nitroreductase [Streptococcus pneumoniae]
MKFLELNKKRHATKHFTDKPVDPKDVRTAIEIATLAPSAHNSQPWKFVVVREKNANWQSWLMVQTLSRYHQHL